jgi:hypothetical protein
MNTERNDMISPQKGKGRPHASGGRGSNTGSQPPRSILSAALPKNSHGGRALPRRSGAPRDEQTPRRNSRQINRLVRA